MTDKSYTFHNDGTYEVDGKTYYLVDIRGTGMVSNTGMYRLDVSVGAIPASVAAELFLCMKDAAMALLLEKGVAPPDAIGVRIAPTPPKFDA